MATKGITNVQSLSVLISFIRDNSERTAEFSEFASRSGLNGLEILAKAEHHLAKLAKPKAKSEGPTKAQLQNANLANALVEAMAKYGEPITAKWIAENVPGIMTPQKAVAVVHAAGDQVVKFYENRQALYRLA